ncbi:hypothetical protein NW759_015963 [Fusarium solani]|nr:hypothetical protein NW759_015963 [Fusarium solani]
MVPVDDVIRELSHAPEQEIRNEYLNLRKPRSKNYKQDIQGFLEEGITSQWIDIRHKFPGIGAATFLSTCTQLKYELNGGGKTKEWARVTFKTQVGRQRLRGLRR